MRCQHLRTANAQASKKLHGVAPAFFAVLRHSRPALPGGDLALKVLGTLRARVALARVRP